MSITSATLAAAQPLALVKTINGEYTAASVLADQKDALSLGLIKQKDGNYDVLRVNAVSSSILWMPSPAGRQALDSLTLGG